ncbi:hypothetical protein BC829DRAFT_401628 [Chytridium lagenaria]|nr:hypothetical protein BC829DRAFT_401628 [Chytridium lagenaria]
MSPPTAAEAVSTATAPIKKSHPEHEHAASKVPSVEEPILRELFDYRHGLQHLRKASHGAITLADVDSKANELALIMHRLREIRENELEGVQRNRVDDVLDSIWMILFYIWGKIAAMDESIYPIYVSLVSVTVQPTLSVSLGMEQRDIEPLQTRLRELEEASTPLLGTTDQGDHIPRGQAVLATLLNRATVPHLKPVYHELNSILHELEALPLDEVPSSSPLKPYERTLLDIRTRLLSLQSNTTVRSNQTTFSSHLANIQHDLSAVESRRNLDDGTFIPHGDAYSLSPSEAAILQGQARLHHLLKQCHALITSLIDPICRPVSETLLATYEDLILWRSRIRAIRRRALSNNTPDAVRASMDEAAAAIAKVEGTRVRGLFRGPVAVVAAAVKSARTGGVDVQEEDLLAWLNPQSKSAGVPEGQAAVSALLDECESLLWETKCLVEFKWG